MLRVSVSNTQKDLLLSNKSVRALFQELLLFFSIETNLISIHLVTKKRISFLHQQFFMDPSPTDCISQPIDPPSATDLSFHCLGELFVCPKVAIEESEKRGSTPLNELRLYLVHSFLHLIGYEDHNEEALKKMRQAEEKTLFFLDKKQIHLK